MSVVYQDDALTVHHGDALAVLATLPDESVNCVVTSPPYWGLRDYGVDGQVGLERTPDEYVAKLVDIFRDIRRVLRLDGTVWLNLGDSYANDTKWGGSSGGKHVAALHGQTGIGRQKVTTGLKPKDLIGIPWRVAFALQTDGWWLRRDIVWAKPNPMPESITDRPTSSHEYLFLLTKSARYCYDAEAVREPAVSGPSDLRKMAESRERIGGRVKELDDPKMKASGLTNIGRKRSVGGKQLASAQASSASTERRMGGFNARWDESESNGAAPVGRNLRSVWTIATEPYPGAHFATFPTKLVETCVLAGCPKGGVVLDPFAGSGTTGLVAGELGRKAILIDLNTDYIRQAIVRASRGLVDPGGHDVPDDSLWAVGS